MRVTRDLDLAEEAVQEAYVKALSRWPVDGVPDRPGAWLVTTARRLALNTMRRQRTLTAKLPLLVEPEEAPEPEDPAAAVPDDRLRLIFTCCHPALAPEAQIALTLRLVCGIPTADIARALLLAEPTVAARLTRAKKKIAAAGIRYAVPESEDLPARLDSVLTVIHLLYTAGYTARTGPDLVRDELTSRALDLAGTLRDLMPANAEVAGLLALLLVHEARAATRIDDENRLVRLAEQDRSRWDRSMISQAHRLVVSSMGAGPAGRFTLQAAIASVHAQAPSSEQTDWPQIVALYDGLLRVWPTPVVALNRAIAVSMAQGPAAGLDLLDDLAAEGRLDRYLYLHAARADLLGQLGRDREAVDAYRSALDLAANSAEQEFLTGRIDQLAHHPAPGPADRR